MSINTQNQQRTYFTFNVTDYAVNFNSQLVPACTPMTSHRQNGPTLLLHGDPGKTQRQWDKWASKQPKINQNTSTDYIIFHAVCSIKYNKYVNGDWPLSTHANPTSTRRTIFHEQHISSGSIYSSFIVQSGWFACRFWDFGRTKFTIKFSPVRGLTVDSSQLTSVLTSKSRDKKVGRIRNLDIVP